MSLHRLARLAVLTLLLSSATWATPRLSADDDLPAPEAPLVSWLKAFRRGKAELDVAGLGELRDLVKEVEASAASSSPPADDEAAAASRANLREAYFDLASLELIPKRRSSSDSEPQNPLLVSARELGTLALHGLLDADDGMSFALYLSTELLPAPKAELAHRVVAASLFEGRHLELSRAPLLQLASSEKKILLRTAALKSLIGWPHPAITRFILDGIDLAGDSNRNDFTVPLTVATRHLTMLKEQNLKVEQQVKILQFLRPSLASERWREASRALALSASISSDEIYPVLIDSLEVWLNRRGTELASRRIESDLVDNLTLRSGRHLRDNADRWRHWWKLVEAGEVPPPAKEGEDDGSSRASFFSLRPVTQRVTFVIDRSGSMSKSFGEDPLHTRLDEAYDQTIGFLQLSGEEVEFNVILFGDEFVRWKPRMQPATERNLAALRSWLASNGPAGGTHLREAVEEALELRRDGTADLSRLTSDTIIVLCDGKTVAGTDWIVPTLASIAESAQLVFNCVQIGKGGDACLKLLARESGGDFIHIKE